MDDIGTERNAITRKKDYINIWIHIQPRASIIRFAIRDLWDVTDPGLRSQHILMGFSISFSFFFAVE